MKEDHTIVNRKRPRDLNELDAEEETLDQELEIKNQKEVINQNLRFDT